MSAPIDLDDVTQARRVLQDVAIRTPMEESRWLSALAGAPVLLKCENLQRTGSFKIRGAYLRMARLTPEERAHGVVAASAGNHAQGVALAAQLLGIRSRVFMPYGAPIPKENATRAYGAEVEFHGASVDEALEAARAHADRTGAVLVHPYDHRDIVLGQATCGTEILEQAPEVRTVVVPTGGGGLVAGIATAIKLQRPDVRVVGVQAAGAAAYPASLAAGRPVAVDRMKTMADGIAVGLPGDVPFAAIRDHVDEIVTVDEESLSRAVLSTLERAKLVLEPAGAAAVAALLDDPHRWEGPTVAVLSGGNIDPLLLQRVVAHGLAASGRYMTLRIPLPDRPGQLARVSELLAHAGANVIEVLHTRHGQGLQISEVILQLSVETRGEEHRAHVIAVLEEAGFTPTVVPD